VDLLGAVRPVEVRSAEMNTGRDGIPRTEWRSGIHHTAMANVTRGRMDCPKTRRASSRDRWRYPRGRRAWRRHGTDTAIRRRGESSRRRPRFPQCGADRPSRRCPVAWSGCDDSRSACRLGRSEHRPLACERTAILAGRHRDRECSWRDEKSNYPPPGQAPPAQAWARPPVVQDAVSWGVNLVPSVVCWEVPGRFPSPPNAPQ